MDDDVFTRSLAVLRSLDRERVAYVLVGGVALNVHGLVRATEDLDIVIRPDEANVERLRRALRAVWDDPEIDAITAEDLGGAYPVVRYGPPEGTLYVDILARIGERLGYDDLEIEEHLIEGVRVRVASPRALYRLKKATVRPIDHVDAAALKQMFGLDEED